MHNALQIALNMIAVGVGLFAIGCSLLALFILTVATFGAAKNADAEDGKKGAR